MAKIEFRAKVETIYNVDETVAFQRIKVPTLTRKHCDMNAFRCHPRFGSYANSDLFAGMLKRIKSDRLGDYVRLDCIPNDVDVDLSGFLAKVSIEV